MAGYIPFGKGDAWLRATRSLWLASAGPAGQPHEEQPGTGDGQSGKRGADEGTPRHHRSTVPRGGAGGGPARTPARESRNAIRLSTSACTTLF